MPYYREPDEVTGYALDVCESFWQVCVPHATRNLIHDPSFEMSVDDDEHTIEQEGMMGAFAALTSTYVTRWFTAEESGAHTLSAYVRLASGQARRAVTISLRPVPNPAIVIATKTFTVEGDGKWHRIHVVGPCTTTLQYLLYVESDVAFYTDCCQAEPGGTLTTYVDGDLGAYAPHQPSEYYWEGAAHASVSVRTARTRTGGKLVPLSDTGFRTTTLTGIGAAPLERPLVRSADGTQVARQALYGARELTLGGTIYGETFDQLAIRRRAINDLFSTRLFANDDPILLRVQLTDEGEPLDIYVRYVDGLAGEINNRHQQRFAMRLQAIEHTAFLGQYRSAVLPFPAEYMDVYVAVKDLETGEWNTWFYGASPQGMIHTLAFDAAGNLYAGGGMNKLVHLLTDSVTPNTEVGSNLSGSYVTSMDIIGSGDSLRIAVGGSMNVGADATTVALYNGQTDTWTRMGRGTTGGTGVYHVLHANGLIFVAGDFTGVVDGDGTAHDFKYFAVYNPTDNTWSQPFTFAAYASGGIFSMAKSPDGLIYLGGLVDPAQFTNNTDRMMVYNPYTDSFWWMTPPYPPVAQGGPLYPGTAAGIMRVAPDGRPFLLTLVGTAGFRSILLAPGKDAPGELVTPSINGKSDWSWNSLDVTFDAFNVTHWPGLAFDRNGGLYVAGPFNYADGTPSHISDPIVSRVWSRRGRAQVTSLDIYRSGMDGDAHYTPLVISNNKLAVAPNSLAFPTYIGQATRVVHEGSDPTNAVLTVYGPCKMHSLFNWTTRRQFVLTPAIWIGEEESVLIYARDGALWWERGGTRDAVPYPLPIVAGASDARALELIPGDNWLSVVTEDSTGDNPDHPVSINWRTAHGWL